jgi:spermidine/putrescine transport system permease protein
MSAAGPKPADRSTANRPLKLNRNYGPLYSLPMGAWFTIFFLAPFIIIIIYSVMKKSLYGGIEPHFSLNAYRSLANPNFVVIAVRTLLTSAVATFITILIALPCGYYMAKSRNQTFLLLLIIIPFWTNFLIRVFAWMNILGSNGFLVEFLNRTGLTGGYVKFAESMNAARAAFDGFFKSLIGNQKAIDFLTNIGIFKGHVNEPLMFLYNQSAVTLVLVYMYLPYAILPLFSTIDKFDFSLLEAARDLGATKMKAMFKVLMPNIKSGIYTAVLFTFIPIFGAYAVPLLVGGKDSYMLGNVIADQLTKAKNLPLSSSISLVLTVITTAGVMIMMNLQRREARRLKDVSGIAETANPEAEAVGNAANESAASVNGGNGEL